MDDGSINISAADLKVRTDNVTEMATRLAVHHDELKSQLGRTRHEARNKKAKALGNTIQSVYKQVDTLTQIQNATEMVVEGFKTAVGLKCEHNLGVGRNVDTLHSEMLECLRLMEENGNCK